MTTAKKTGAAKKAAPRKATSATAKKPAGRLDATIAISEDVAIESRRGDGAVVLYTPPPVNDPAQRGRSGVVIDDTTAQVGP